MANSSSLRAPDWIAAAGMGRALPEGKVAPPGWISALGSHRESGPSGFRAVSPFGDVAPEPKPEPKPAPPPTDTESLEDEAYMRGFAEGHAEAKRAGEQALATERARYHDLRVALRALDAAGLEALAQDLNVTVLALCEHVLGEYALDAEALMARCRAAAARLGAGPGELTLHLHPQTRKLIGEGVLDGWTLEDDPALAPGALRVTGADGAVRDGPEDWKRAFVEALGA